MKQALAQTGTAELLETLSVFVPDEFINQIVDQRRRRGRRRTYSAAQMYRTLLLALLTPAHSFNLLARLLVENRAWRRFALLPNRHEVPDATLLHDFRVAIGVSGLRRINRHLLTPLLEGSAVGSTTVAIIDATDLPAASSSYKKN
jgi:hypothetical protein